MPNNHPPTRPIIVYPAERDIFVLSYMLNGFPCVSLSALASAQNMEIIPLANGDSILCDADAAAGEAFVWSWQGHIIAGRGVIVRLRDEADYPEGASEEEIARWEDEVACDPLTSYEELQAGIEWFGLCTSEASLGEPQDGVVPICVEWVPVHHAVN